MVKEDKNTSYELENKILIVIYTNENCIDWFLIKIKIRQYEITIFILSLTHDIGNQKWRWIGL